MFKLILWLALFGFVVPSVFSMGHSYEEVYKPNSRYKKYVVHTFSFNENEIKEMAKSPNGAAPYGRAVLEGMWKVGGFGDPEGIDWESIAKFIGRISLNVQLYKIAKENKDADYLEIKFQSRADNGGKIGLKIWNKAAELWKEMAGF